MFSKETIQELLRDPKIQRYVEEHQPTTPGLQLLYDEGYLTSEHLSLLNDLGITLDNNGQGKGNDNGEGARR